MTKIKIIVENDLGESVELKSYELGSDFDKMYKLENAISAISGNMLTDITATVLSLEESAFLKKANTKPMEATK